MEKIRFRIATSVDRCFGTQLALRNCCRSCFSKFIQSRHHRPLYFAHVKVATSTLLILFFAMHDPDQNKGIRRSTAMIPRVVFHSVLFMEWAGAVMLIFAYKKRNPRLSLSWCLLQALTILILLLLTLSELVRISLTGLILLGLESLLKLYGLWLVYYFYLELRNSPDMEPIDSKPSKDSFDIKYFTRSRSRKDSAEDEEGQGQDHIPNPGARYGRKDTDRTSVFSSEETLSPPAAEILGHGHRRSTLESNTSETEAPFKLHFFPSSSSAEIMGKDSLRSSSSTDPEIEGGKQFNLKYAEVEVICEKGQSQLETMPTSQETSGNECSNEGKEAEVWVQRESSTFSNLMCGGTSSINVES